MKNLRVFLQPKGRKHCWDIIRAVVLSTALLYVYCPPAAIAAGGADEEKIETVTEDGITYLGTPKHVWWADGTTAKWSSVKKAYRYQVRLFENGESVTRVTVDGLSYDFREYIKEGCTYSFEARAVSKTYIQHYVSEDGWRESADQIGISQGEVYGRWRNYQEGSKYQKKDGSFAEPGWLMVLGRWYYFDSSGYVVKNDWIEEDGSRYYLSGDGGMSVGWSRWEGNWYYFGENGAMQVGWLQTQPGEWYYLNQDGTMAYNTTIDGYLIDENGLCRR